MHLSTLICLLVRDLQTQANLIGTPLLVAFTRKSQKVGSGYIGQSPKARVKGITSALITNAANTLCMSIKTTSSGLGGMRGAQAT
jgi:hypothetical protein